MEHEHARGIIEDEEMPDQPECRQDFDTLGSRIFEYIYQQEHRKLLLLASCEHGEYYSHIFDGLCDRCRYTELSFRCWRLVWRSSASGRLRGISPVSSLSCSSSKDRSCIAFREVERQSRERQTSFWCCSSTDALPSSEFKDYLGSANHQEGGKESKNRTWRKCPLTPGLTWGSKAPKSTVDENRKV